ncbi:MAG: thioredoxin domain-containing protein [Chitinophagales bacterium]
MRKPIKNFDGFILLLLVVWLTSCNNSSPSATNLSAEEFSVKLKQQTSAQLIDVRTAEEFSKGHLTDALNIDWNGEDFEKEVSKLDKSKPVYVYCLSGGRSASAAAQMRENGFVTVYEMDGGIMKWRAAGLPETTKADVVSPGMSLTDYNQLLDTDKLVLVDFYADWCAPCKKMAPYLEELKTEEADRMVVVRVNADDNQSLCKELKIDALPTLILYKKQDIVWKNTGFIEKDDVLQHL